MQKLCEITNKEAAYNSFELVVTSYHKTVSEILFLMKDVILSEPMFGGDLRSIYEALTQIKQLAFHFLKIYW